MPRAHARWSPEEEALIRAHYPAGGIDVCRQLLPHRTAKAIISRVGFLGVTMEPGAKHEAHSRGGRGGKAPRKHYSCAALEHALGGGVSLLPNGTVTRSHRLT